MPDTQKLNIKHFLGPPADHSILPLQKLPLSRSREAFSRTSSDPQGCTRATSSAPWVSHLEPRPSLHSLSSTELNLGPPAPGCPGKKKKKTLLAVLSSYLSAGRPLISDYPGNVGQPLTAGRPRQPSLGSLLIISTPATPKTLVPSTTWYFGKKQKEGGRMSRQGRLGWPSPLQLGERRY